MVRRGAADSHSLGALPAVLSSRPVRPVPGTSRLGGREHGSIGRCYPIDRGVSDLSTLGIWICARRSLAPRRASLQRRGRPISKKALFILECNAACEDTALSPWNDNVRPDCRSCPAALHPLFMS